MSINRGDGTVIQLEVNERQKLPGASTHHYLVFISDQIVLNLAVVNAGLVFFCLNIKMLFLSCNLLHIMSTSVLKSWLSHQI